MALGTSSGLSLAERLDSGLESLQLAASELQRTQLLDFVALLNKWNSVYNLTAVRSPEDMLSVHLLDALSILQLVDSLGGQTVVDVGSGAGIPAIPLAILRPQIQVHSIDAVSKKIGFQLQVKSALRLANLHPRHARIETFALPAEPSIVISRAFADIPTMLDLVDHLTREGTYVIAMKGRTPTDELAGLSSAWQVHELKRLDVPFLGAQRCAVVLRRTSHAEPA